MCVIDIFVVQAGILTILFSWFKTNVFYEYCALFGGKSFFREFDNYPNLSYPQYLFINKEKITSKVQYRLFFIKLITCPVCLGFWLCVIGAVILQNVLLVFPLYIMTLFLYGLLDRLFA
jgi:hypothetical protein